MGEQNGTVDIHPAFTEAGKKVGIEIWRIEDFEPVFQDPKTYGQFYNGDVYLILNTTQAAGSSKFTFDLHFWLGVNSSQDEQGSAAMRTVELDEMVLGGAAVQYREVQGHESKLLLSYFKNGIRYLEGGVKSGFNTYDPTDYVKRLFQVKGKKSIRVEQVECKCGSLNQGDTFVLDDNQHIYVWIGPKSETKEQHGGLEMAKSIRDDERGGSAHIHVIEEDWETNEEFFKALGSKDKTIKAASDEDDEEIVRKLEQETLLYQVEEGGSKGYTAHEVASKPLQQSVLDSNNCYVLDSGYSGIFLWTGKSCSSDFKSKVWDAVNQFLKSRGYPSWVTVTRVVDGGETALFKQYFESWTDPWDESKPGENGSNIADTDYSGAESIDATAMHKKAGKAEEWMPDDGTGTVKVYCIVNNDLREIPEKAYGVFFGEDCYIIEYSYKDSTGRDQHIVYFWQGQNSKTDDKTSSALLTMKIDNDLGGEAVQVRVVMNKEPSHFLKIFKGRLILFMNGKVKDFNSIDEYKGYDPTKKYMFHIRGSNENETRAIEVDCRAASLNAGDIFLVDTPDKLYAWVGKYSNDQEKEMARFMAKYVASTKGEPTIFKEGDETNEFWDAVGGEEPYYTGQKKQGSGVCLPPRLFQCSNKSGKFTVEELVNFSQEDLDPSDVMLLDTYDEIFIWVGKEANEFEKKESAKTASKYLESDPTGRNDNNTLIIVVHQGSEPPQFSGCFHTWDINKWSGGKTFHEMVDEVGKENAGVKLLEDEVKKYTSFYPLEELQKNPPPEGVDATKKEMYLSDDDFKSVFMMTKEEYLAMPEWKRNDLRKKHGLF